MRDHAVRCAAFRCGHFPLVGGSRNQHGARSGAGLAYILVRFADGAASGRKLTTPHTVAREVLPGSRKFGRDLQPVAFQLLGHELGEARHRALPHLGAGDADHDAVVRLDHDPGRNLRGALRGAASARQPADRQPRIWGVSHTVVIGGGVGARCFSLMAPTIASVLERHRSLIPTDVNVRVAETGDDAGLLGAALGALQNPATLTGGSAARQPAAGRLH